MKTFLALIFTLICFNICSSQYHFSGQLKTEAKKYPVYLSLVDDYRKLNRVYLDQIIAKTIPDSLGNFTFEGDFLPATNNIYRLHIDSCEASTTNSNHLFKDCGQAQSLLFIANGSDTIYFSQNQDHVNFCDIKSTNPSSNAILKIDELKEQMIYDLSNIQSVANQKLNFAKWFSKFQGLKNVYADPLAELYSYAFLSSKSSETYHYYLNDIKTNSYYKNLLERLANKYPNSTLSTQYKIEIKNDLKVIEQSSTDYKYWFWLLVPISILSVGVNFFLLYKKNESFKKTTHPSKNITKQEHKIVQAILADKSNKEIAAELFISVSTVKTHINNLYKKLNINSRTDIVKIFKSQ